MNPVLVAGGGLGFIFLMTCLGAATVFFFRKGVSDLFRQIFLGFAAGIMIAASVWSLLIPAIENTETAVLPEWAPVAGGFALGVLFLLMLDRIIPHLHPFSDTREGSGFGTGTGSGSGSAAASTSVSKRTTLLIAAVTLHNIPEGMAIGLSFAFAAQHSGDPAMIASATALAVGIGIQNFPEGAAISLPLRQEGMPARKAFLLSCLTGAVEPLFGALTFVFGIWLTPVMPWLLSFAAGSMIYVVVEELIPEARLGTHSHAGALSVMGGFLLMMVLDIAL